MLHVHITDIFFLIVERILYKARHVETQLSTSLILRIIHIDKFVVFTLCTISFPLVDIISFNTARIAVLISWFIAVFTSSLSVRVSLHSSICSSLHSSLRSLFPSSTRPSSSPVASFTVSFIVTFVVTLDTHKFTTYPCANMLPERSERRALIPLHINAMAPITRSSKAGKVPRKRSSNEVDDLELQSKGTRARIASQQTHRNHDTRAMIPIVIKQVGYFQVRL